MLTKDGICTMANIVIANPIQAYLLLRCCTTQGFVALDAVQAEERNYHDQHPINQFFALAIDVFGCLHNQANVFLHYCVNAIWSLKGLEGPPLSILVTFLQQKISITLQRMQAFSILSRVVAVSLTTSQLPPLQDTPPTTMIDLLQVIDL
jgi:hypothetical protein